MYSKRCNSSVLGLLKASPYRSASPQVPYPLCQVSQKLVWVLLKWVWFQWGHGEGKFWQRVQIFIFILAMGVVWCLLCETCADFDVPHVAKPFTWFCDSRSSKSVTPQTNLQCNVSRKRKKKCNTTNYHKSNSEIVSKHVKPNFNVWKLFWELGLVGGHLSTDMSSNRTAGTWPSRTCQYQKLCTSQGRDLIHNLPEKQEGGVRNALVLPVTVYGIYDIHTSRNYTVYTH